MKNLFSIFKFSIIGFCILTSIKIDAQKLTQRQKLDSLELQLTKETEPKKQVDLLITIAATYTQFDNQIAIEKGEKSITIAQEYNLKDRLAGVYNNTAFCYAASGNLDKAAEYYNESIKHSEYAADSTTKGQALRGLGMINAEKSDFPEALKYAFASIKEFEKLGKKESLCYSYGFIGQIYSRMKKLDESEKYYLKSILLAEELDLRVATCHLLLEVCDVYLAKDNTNLAFSAVNKSITISNESGSMRSLMGGYQVLGNIYLKEEKLDSAAHYYNLSLEVNQKIKDKQSEANLLLKLGETYRLKNELITAKTYFLQSEKIAKESNFSSITLDIHKGLYQVNKTLGDSKNAFKYVESYMALKDSIYNKENDEKIAEKKVQYEYDKKSALDKLEYEKNIEKEKAFQTYLAIGLALLAGLFFFALRAFLIKKRSNKKISDQNAQLEQYNKVNENLIFSLSHDIKEPMLGVKILLDKIDSKDPYLQKAASSIGNQVASINGIVNNLLQLKKSAKSNNKEISSHTEILQTIEKIQNELNYKLIEKNITIINKIKDSMNFTLPISSQKLYLTLYNLLTNAIKYSPENSNIELIIRDESLFVRDYGSGIDSSIMSKIGKEDIDKDDDSRGSGMGLMLVSNLLVGSKVKLHFENAVGGGTLAGIVVV